MLKFNETITEEKAIKLRNDIIDSEKMDASLKDSCFGINFNPKDNDCKKDCEHKTECPIIEKKVKEALELSQKNQEEKVMPEKKEVKKEVKVFTKEDSIALNFDYSKFDKEISIKIKNTAQQIKASQAQIVSNMVELGKYLFETKSMLSEKPTLFLEWSMVEFGLIPAQIYSAINVYKRFGNVIKKLDNKVSVSTLVELSKSKYADDDIEKIVDSISKDKLKGTLDSIEDFVAKLHQKEAAKEVEKSAVKQPVTVVGELEQPVMDIKANKEFDLGADDDEEMSFATYIQQSERFLKTIQSVDTLSEAQFKEVKTLFSVIQKISEELKFKLPADAEVKKEVKTEIKKEKVAEPKAKQKKKQKRG
jgi:hypothetical protein